MLSITSEDRLAPSTGQSPSWPKPVPSFRVALTTRVCFACVPQLRMRRRAASRTQRQFSRVQGPPAGYLTCAT